MADLWVISEPIDVRSRIHINSMRPIFAHFDARLVPSGEHSGIRVVEEWEDPEDGKWLAAVKEGVDRFVGQRVEAGRPVGHTSLVMLRVISHPVDTDAYAVARNVTSTLRIQFDAHESML